MDKIEDILVIVILIVAVIATVIENDELINKSVIALIALHFFVYTAKRFFK